MAARAWKGRVRAFRSRAEISIKQRDDDPKNFAGSLYTRAAGIILMRSIITMGAAEPVMDILRKPFPVMETVADFKGLLVESMKTLHIPSEYLSLLAEDLMHQLMVVSTDFFGRDPRHSYMIFLDVKINMEGEDCKFTPDDHFFVNPTGELAESILGACRELYVLRKSSRMKEVKTCVSDRRNDADWEIVCPVCMEEMCLGEEYVTTPCKHTYHTSCLGPWLVSTYKSQWIRGKIWKQKFPICPMCRQYLLASVS